MSIVHWTIALVSLGLEVLFIVAAVRILHRLGFSGWWTVLSFLPIVNIVAVWLLANADWPAVAPRLERARDTF